MPLNNETVISPIEPCGKPPAGNKGTGSHQENGEKGYPGRTATDRGVPEVTRDENVK